MSRVKQMAPYALRASASASLIMGSVYNIIYEQERVNPLFFVCSIYASAIYLSTNAKEAYNAFNKPIAKEGESESFIERELQRKQDKVMELV